MDSVSFQQFEAARVMAQSRMSPTQSSGVDSARKPDWAALIDSKKREMDESLSSSISGKSRSSTIEEAAPISGMFKNLGRVANQYLASQVSEKELTSTPHKKMLGNYVDVSV